MICNGVQDVTRYSERTYILIKVSFFCFEFSMNPKIMALLFTLSTLAFSDSLPTIQQLRSYDESRIRIFSDSTRRSYHYPIGICGERIFTDSIRPFILQTVPTTIELFETADSKRRAAKICFIAGGIFAVPATVTLIAEAPFIIPIIGFSSSVLINIPGTVFLVQSIHSEIETYHLYESFIRETNSIATFTNFDNPSTPEENYMAYLYQSLRMNLDYVSNEFSGSPWVLSGKPIQLDVSSASTATEIAIDNALLQSADLLSHADRLEKGSLIMQVSGGVISSGAMSAALIGGLSILSGSGPSDEFFVTCGVLLGAGGGMTLASFPMSARANRLYLEGLVSYDSELRNKYGILITCDIATP